MAKITSVENTGFSTAPTTKQRRFVNRDGSPNVRKIGLGLLERYSLYHTLMQMNRLVFVLLVFLVYNSINVVFSFIYLAIGVEHLQGIPHHVALLEDFEAAFFFSSQTLTTVGYGHISPVGFAANATAAVESFLGIIIFAMVAGLFFARLSKPKAYIRFSRHIILAPYRAANAIMFRLASYKNNNLTMLSATITVSLVVKEESGEENRKFYNLPLELDKIGALPLSWTCVHALSEESPMFGFTATDFERTQPEFIVSITAFDDHYANTVQQRTSYSYHEFRHGQKFTSMIISAEDGSSILDFDMLNQMEKTAI